MKRVLMIIQNFHPVIGGAEKQALELSRGLVKKGISVTVLTRHVPAALPREKIDNVDIIRLPVIPFSFLNPLSFVLSSLFFLLFHLNEFDVYHVHLASSHAIIPSLLGRLFKKKVLIKLSGGKDIGELALSRRSLLGRLKIKLIAWGKPLLIMVNADQENEINLSGLSHLKKTLIPNGVSLEHFSPVSDEKKQELRRKFGWSGVIYLFVGRFSSDKLRLDIFENLLNGWVQAFPEMGARFFYLVGTGPLERDYENLILKKGLQSVIKLMGPQNPIVDLYQAADIFVLPSITEGLSNAMLEAMACGLPVLGSDVSGIQKLIDNEQNGYLFDPLTSSSFAQVLKMIDNSIIIKNFKKSSQQKAKLFDLNHTVESIANCYGAT